LYIFLIFFDFCRFAQIKRKIQTKKHLILGNNDANIKLSVGVADKRIIMEEVNIK